MLYAKVVDDPSGNSFIENKMAPLPDPNCTVEHYKRTKEQSSMLGLCVDESAEVRPGVMGGSSRCYKTWTPDR